MLARLNEGKVYIPEQAKRAILKFFRKGNLSALRELSLRRAAERVDYQMRDYMRTRAISGPWPASERLLVCISPSPLAEKLVRTTRRLADELKAEWFAVHVEVGTKPETNLVNREHTARALQLAEELGARTRILSGRSITESILTYAQKHNVTKIVIGKPVRPRWREWINGSIVDQLIYDSGNIDVFVISSRVDGKDRVIPGSRKPPVAIIPYLIGTGMIALATMFGLLIRGNLEPANLVMLYLAATVLAALYLGRGPSFLVSILGVIAFDFFLVPPYMTLAVRDTQYFITFIGLLAVSLVVSTLTTRVREQAEAAIQREAHTSALYTLGRDLTSATDLKHVAEIILSHTSQVFGREVSIFIPENGHLECFLSTPGYQPDTNETGVAAWVFEHDRPAGLGTDTLPAVPLRCLPLKTARGLVGVLGVRPWEAGRQLTPQQRQTLDSFAHQAALAVERARLDEQARQAELLKATEKLQTSLLNSISHDLRTPLVSITGALSSLKEKSLALDNDARASLLDTAYGEAERLNRLVGNLLNMTRIEADAIHLKKEPCDLQDVIGTALEQLGERLGDRQVNVDLPPELKLVQLDSALFEQALVNLLENAVKYSDPETQIEIKVTQTTEMIEISICDRGIGIPSEDLERVFDKFYRVQRPESVSGTGLGLAICKGIIEAHGGKILAENRAGGGTIIKITFQEASSE